MYSKLTGVSSLPKTVPGKLQYISDLQAMGVLSPFQIPRLISNPDIDAVIDPMMAVTDLIYKKIDKILDEGQEGFEAPDPMGDLQQETTLFTQAYSKAQFDNAPEDRINFIRQYLIQLKELMQPTPPPPTPAPAGANAVSPQPAPQGPSTTPAAPLPGKLNIK